MFFNFNRIKEATASVGLSNNIINFNTIFISIVIEAIPFILLGVFFSAIIQLYVSEDVIKKYLPRNPIAALLPAAVLGAIFPICECAIVPVVRRLVKKGMPLHVGVVFFSWGTHLKSSCVCINILCVPNKSNHCIHSYGTCFCFSDYHRIYHLLILQKKQ
ncbi:MAG: permease [Bacillaceae bacterium]|nr:permease [Bacillaceae bacterium]